MNKIMTAVLAASTIIISANANAMDLFEGTILSDNWQPGASSSQPTTYRSRGNERFTGSDGSTLRSRSNGRLVDSHSGVTYRDRGNGRLTGNNGSTCRDRGNGRIVCY